MTSYHAKILCTFFCHYVRYVGYKSENTTFITAGYEHISQLYFFDTATAH